MKNKRGVVSQAAKNAKDAHALDERTKALHKSIHNSHLHAHQFHKAADATKKRVETKEAAIHPRAGITEKDLQRSAEEQYAEMALIGNRLASHRKKSA